MIKVKCNNYNYGIPKWFETIKDPITLVVITLPDGTTKSMTFKVIFDMHIGYIKLIHTKEE